MGRTKRMLTVLLCIVMMLATTLPVHAANARLSHGVTASVGFDIGADGYSELLIDYTANSTSFTHITVESYIQKRSLGFIWTKVDNGEPNKTWVDTSTANYGYFFHTMQFDSTGTYRVVFKITFSGTGAADDVIEDKIERTYG